MNGKPTEVSVDALLAHLTLPTTRIKEIEIVSHIVAYQTHYIYFILRHPDVPLPKVGFRPFNSDTLFAGVQDFIDELWCSPDLMPVAIAA